MYEVSKAGRLNSIGEIISAHFEHICISANHENGYKVISKKVEWGMKWCGVGWSDVGSNIETCSFKHFKHNWHGTTGRKPYGLMLLR